MLRPARSRDAAPPQRHAHAERGRLAAGARWASPRRKRCCASPRTRPLNNARRPKPEPKPHRRSPRSKDSSCRSFNTKRCSPTAAIAEGQLEAAGRAGGVSADGRPGPAPDQPGREAPRRNRQRTAPAHAGARGAAFRSSLGRQQNLRARCWRISPACFPACWRRACR